MPISPERIQTDIKAIAAFTQTPNEGATRPTFSPAWRSARDYVIAQLETIGCSVRIDAIGNVHARPAAIAWDTAAWLSGSHLDTLAHAGDFDGAIGLALALEAFRAAREDLKVAIPLELVIWTEQEGATFGLPMLGCRAFVGAVDVPREYLDAGASMGLRPNDLALPEERLCAKSIIGHIAVRVDPSATLWNDGAPVGLVTRLHGQRESRCTLSGSGGSAGAIPIAQRRDALAGAAQLITSIEHLARESDDCLITVTRIESQPNARGEITQRADLWIDARSAATDALARADTSIQSAIARIAGERGLDHEIAITRSEPAIDLDTSVCGKLLRVSKPHFPDDSLREISAGGGDYSAAVLARHVRSAILFVASREGIYHHRDEFCRPNDLAIAAKILFDAVRDRRLE